MLKSINELNKVLIDRLDKKVDSILNTQVQDADNRYYGGTWEVEACWSNQKSGMNNLEPLITVFHCDKSRHYKSQRVMKAIDMSFDYCERFQRPDGTFDLFDCNFYSAPDTAFGIQSLWRTYCIIQTVDNSLETDSIAKRLYSLIDRSAQGVRDGGFHTPNHRWVISSALLIAWRVTQNDSYKQRAEDYLAEGIDCNKDGEFSEKSAAIYNVVNDYALLLISEITGDNRYLDYIKRNLEMMSTFYEPDGSIFTMNSRRQDNGQKMYPVRYFYLYYYMAKKLSSKSFMDYACAILQTLLEKESLLDKKESLFDLASFFILKPEWNADLLTPGSYRQSYSALYEQSGIARIREGDFTVSLIRGNPTPISMQLDELALYMRIGISFFSARNFLAQSLVRTDKGYIMTYELEGKYSLPFGHTLPEDSWGTIGMDSREKITAAKLSISLNVEMTADGVDISIATNGCDTVPVKFEFGIPEGYIVDGDYFHCKAQAGMLLTAKDGYVRVNNGNSELTIGPAFADCTYIKSRSGIVEPSESHMNLYFVGMTNFSRTISVRTRSFI